MAEKDQDKAAEARAAEAQRAEAVERIVVTETEDTRRSRALAEAQAEAQRLRMDETVPGGRYKVGDQIVDANGKPVKGEKAD